MKIEIKSQKIVEKTPFGEFPRPHPFDAVLLDNRQIGWRPADPSDPNHKTLHPLSGVPQIVADAVAKQSKDLTGTLKAPQPTAKPAAVSDGKDS